MTKLRGSYLTRFKPAGEEALADNCISVFLPRDVDEYVRSLPNRAGWLRSAIAEAMQRDLQNTKR